MNNSAAATGARALSAERADLIETMATHRDFLRRTVRGLTDEQAKARTTVSELCLGGIIKHVAAVERNWTVFILGEAGDLDFSSPTEEQRQRWKDEFTVREGETLAGLLQKYDEVAARTEEIVATLPDLDVSYPLPKAPWFAPGARWSARRALLHIIAETAQHAGHADIIRESLDGAKTMG